MVDDATVRESLRAAFKRFADYGQTKYRKSEAVGFIIGLNRLQFTKLCRDSGLYNNTFQQADADLLFSRLKTSNDDLSLDFNHFLEALECIAKKQHQSMTDIIGQVIRGKPSLEGGSNPGFVRLHDDKANTYTGVNAYSVGAIKSCPTLLHPMLQRRYRNVLSSGIDRIRENASAVSSVGSRVLQRTVSDVGPNAYRQAYVPQYSNGLRRNTKEQSATTQPTPASVSLAFQPPPMLEIPSAPGSMMQSPAAWSEQLIRSQESVTGSRMSTGLKEQLLSLQTPSTITSRSSQSPGSGRRYRRSSSDTKATFSRVKSKHSKFDPDRLMDATVEAGQAETPSSAYDRTEDEWPALGKSYSFYLERNNDECSPRSLTNFSELVRVPSTISVVSALSDRQQHDINDSFQVTPSGGSRANELEGKRPELLFRRASASDASSLSLTDPEASVRSISSSRLTRRFSQGTSSIAEEMSSGHISNCGLAAEESQVFASAFLAPMTTEDVAKDVLRLPATFNRFKSQLKQQSKGLHISVEHSWGRFQVYFLRHLFSNRSKCVTAKPTETAEQIKFAKKAMTDFLTEEVAMQRVFNSFSLHGAWNPRNAHFFADREPRMTVTAFTDACNYCLIPSLPKISLVGAQGMFNVVKSKGTSRLVFWQFMDVLAGISQAMDVPLEKMRSLVAAPYLTRNDMPALEMPPKPAEELKEVAEPVEPTRTIVRATDIYSGLFATRNSLHSFF